MKKRFLFTATLVSLLLLAVTVSALAAPASSAVYLFADGEPVPGASASLVRTDGNVAMTLRTTELDPGAYTVWWVVFNDPENCEAGLPNISNCGEDDVAPGTLANVSPIFAAGHVVGINGVGNFSAGLREGDISGALFGDGLVDAQGAEIHLIVRSHGEPIPGMVNEQISTFGGGCGVNDCVDPQFAVFVPSP